jgi:integrase/recombinase XerD
MEIQAFLSCPECGCDRIYKDGLRYTSEGQIQRYLCRSCGYRFSKSDLNKKILRRYSSQICVSKEAKNLSEALETKTSAGTESQSAKGKIIEFAWKLQNEGYRPATIKSYGKILKQLAALGADILLPDSVRETIAKQKDWSENTKLFAVTAYQSFLDQVLNVTWKTPKYRCQEKIAYVPTEEDVKLLIAGSGKKLAAFLTLLKETGCRCGEAIRTTWIEVDFQRRTIRIRAEKNSKPRIMPFSTQLAAMLERLPKKSIRVFPGSLGSMRFNLQVTRARQARKLDNPRLLKVSFHSLRHLKGTTEYHSTHDILHVQNLLGHRTIKSTMQYINLEAALYHNSMIDDFHVKIAETLDEACRLLETGFEYVTDMDGKKLFRKRK